MKLVSQQQLAEKAQSILSSAAKLGAQQAKVSIGESLGESVTWRMGELENMTRERDISLTITVWRHDKKGSAHSSDWTQENIATMLTNALAAAQFSTPDNCASLPQQSDYARDDKALIASLQLDPPTQFNVDELQHLANDCERAALESDERIVLSEGACANTRRGQLFIATSNGFAQGYTHGSCALSLEVVAREGERQKGDYDYDHRRHCEDLRSCAQIGSNAAKRAIAALNLGKIDTDNYPVIFAPRVSSSFIADILAGLDGNLQYRNLSYLNGCLAKLILPEWLSLAENPHLPRGMASAPFDSEAIATARSDIVNAGVVQKYLLNNYSARRLAMPVNGDANGARNVFLRAESDKILPYAQLLAHKPRAILITQLMGSGVNMLTGDYSRGACGFYIEDGRRVCALEGITIAGNLRDMARSIIALGDDFDDRGNICAPSIMVSQMMVAQ